MTVERAVLAALLTAAGVPAMGQTKLAELPLEVLAYKSDLIVVGQVLQVGKPTERELALPGAGEPLKGWFADHKVRIERVLKQAEAAAPESADKAPPPEGSQTAAPAADHLATQPAAGVDITVLAKAPAPREQGIGVLSGEARQYPRLVEKSRYVLLLNRLAGQAEYYLPAEAGRYRPALRPEISAVEKAARVEDWPWGQAMEGLSIALVLTKPVVEYQRQQIIAGPSGEKGPALERIGGVQLQAVVALRNGSAQPITLNLYPGDRFLSVVAAGADGKAVEHDFYKYAPAARLPVFAAKHTAVIAPGQVLFVGPEGPGEQGIAISMPLAPGRWPIRAAYSSQRQAGEGEEPKLWTGRIQSAPAQLEVRQPPGSPGPGAGRRPLS